MPIVPNPTPPGNALTIDWSSDWSIGNSSGWYTITSSSMETPKKPLALAVFGDYSLVETQWWYKLKHVKRGTVAGWKLIPSRAAIAAAIREERRTCPRVNARDDYGALLGVRCFDLTKDFRLTSPVQGTVWDSSVLTAVEWKEDGAVRGECGIHAAWPPRYWTAEPEIDCDGNTNIIACVRGMGRFVAGEEGWRAEKVIVDRVFLPVSLWNRWRVLKRLQKLYPEISFEEQPWTLERSLRSAK